jgi:CheY-like chemotaxis protein
MTSPPRDLAAANPALGDQAVMREIIGAELQTTDALARRGNADDARLIAMVTHGMRTPLVSIIGYAKLLQNGEELSRRRSMQVEAVNRIALHLLEIVENMPNLLDITSGRMNMRLQRISVVDLAETCISVINPMAVTRGLNLRVVSAHDAPRHFVTDPSYLRQVLLNLLDNAVKFTDDGSVELRLLAGADVDALRIEVADTGRGIKPARRDQLFKDLDRHSDPYMKGKGLGLKLSARIVQQMGGTIDYQDNPLGGSVLWLELPAIDQPSLSQTNIRTKLPSSGKRVLVVDDIKINLDVIGSFLATAGHTVTLAASGEEAIGLVAQNRFDIILMDVRMPDMDGLETTRRIRTLTDTHGHVPILAMTVDTSFNQLAHCLDAGMDGHIPKPVDYETLIRSVREISARVSSDRTVDPVVPCQT